MKQCPNCEKQISEYAVSCPNCGMDFSGKGTNQAVIPKEEIQEARDRKQKTINSVNILVLIIAIVFPIITTIFFGFNIYNPISAFMCILVVVFSVYNIIIQKITYWNSTKEIGIVIGGFLLALIVGYVCISYVKLSFVGTQPLKEMPHAQKISAILENILYPCCCGLLWINTYYFIEKNGKR